MSDLGRRAVACKWWRWMPGMRWVAPRTGAAGRVRDTGFRVPDPEWGILPDLTDPATLGCLLVLVREAWRIADLAPQECSMPARRRMGWAFRGRFVRESELARMVGLVDSEAEALVAALEAAP